MGIPSLLSTSTSKAVTLNTWPPGMEHGRQGSHEVKHPYQASTAASHKPLIPLRYIRLI